MLPGDAGGAEGAFLLDEIVTVVAVTDLVDAVRRINAGAS
jgi:hypothetical protein